MRYVHLKDKGGWLFDQEKSGLVPFDLHIHDLDVICGLFGVPQQVRCCSCGGGGRGFQELYRWEYRCGGVNVAAEAAWLNASIPFTAQWRVYFERAAVICDGQTVTAYPCGEEPVTFDTEDPVKIPTGINVPPPAGTCGSWATSWTASERIRTPPWCPRRGCWRCWTFWSGPGRRGRGEPAGKLDFLPKRRRPPP